MVGNSTTPGFQGFFYLTFGDTLSLIADSLLATNGGGSTTISNLSVTEPVPELGTMMLLGAGLLGLTIFGKRRKNA